MFANRYTAVVDACSLAPALSRNILLSLAEAEFFRLRWSLKILDETEAAIAHILTAKNIPDAADRAKRARAAMELAFPEARIDSVVRSDDVIGLWPDPNDRHVVGTAIGIGAQTIVTENTRDFPKESMDPLGLELRTADTFVADTIDLDHRAAVMAVARMRARFNQPARTAADLLLDMERSGFLQTVDLLRAYHDFL